MNPILFIPGAVPSSKNSRIRTRSGLFIASKATQKWRKETSGAWLKFKPWFTEMIAKVPKPYYIGMHFVRATRHRWDFNNPCQTIQDEMVHHGWLDDDDVSNMLPVPLLIDGKHWCLDKNRPGVYLTVMKSFCDVVVTDNMNEHVLIKI